MAAGDAMVPLADIFNHKASVVELAPEYAVHGADSSDDEDLEAGSDDDAQEGGSASEGEGEGAGCGAGCSHPDHHHAHKPGHGHSHEHEHEHEQPQEEDATMAPAGIMGVGAGSGGEHSIYGISSANGLHLRLEMAILDKDDHLEIVAASAVPKGESWCFGRAGNVGCCLS